jgi:8-oxo-dGTP diphosphatase
MNQPAEKQRPKVGLAVFIVNSKNQVLLMYRAGKHAPDCWAPPGGHLEFGESFEECAKRETKEESDLDISGVKFITATNDVFVPEKHYVTIQLKANHFSGEAKNMEPGKASKIEWFNLDNLPTPLILSTQNFFDGNFTCLCGSGRKFFDCHKADKSN